jgi:hypothetical protein
MIVLHKISQLAQFNARYLLSSLDFVVRGVLSFCNKFYLSFVVYFHVCNQDFLNIIVGFSKIYTHSENNNFKIFQESQGSCQIDLELFGVYTKIT